MYSYMILNHDFVVSDNHINFNITPKVSTMVTDSELKGVLGVISKFNEWKESLEEFIFCWPVLQGREYLEVIWYSDTILKHFGTFKC